MANIDELKKSPPINATLKFKLKQANVYVSKEGFHFIDHLDPIEDIDPKIDGTKLTESEIKNIENLLQSNSERFQKQSEVVQKYLNPMKAKILDIGCVGGFFSQSSKILGQR